MKAAKYEDAQGQNTVICAQVSTCTIPEKSFLLCLTTTIQVGFEING